MPCEGKEDAIRASQVLVAPPQTSGTLLMTSALTQLTCGGTVSLSLGGGQGNGTTDPSADSDLKGHEVGTRSAEPPRHPLSRLRDKPEIPKLSLAHPNFSKDSMAGSISQDWRINVCVGSRLSMRTR